VEEVPMNTAFSELMRVWNQPYACWE